MSGVATVASFHDPMEAQIVRAMLESAGIDATLADLNLITVDWPMSVALGGVRVQVPVADLEEAKKLVAAYHAGELEYGKDAPETLACGACGSTNIQTVVPAGQKALALAVFALVAAPINTKANRVCKQCGAVEEMD